MKGKSALFIGIVVCFGIMAWGLYSFSEWDKYRMDDFDKSDLERLEEIALDMFDEVDRQSLEPSPDNLMIDSMIGLLDIYSEDIVGVYYVEQDLIFLSYGGFFQSVDGMVFTRNGVELSNTYDYLQFDKGSISYERMSNNIFRFRAGL